MTNRADFAPFKLQRI